MRRYITQRAVAAGTEQFPDAIFALCNDGSIWKLIDDFRQEREWLRMKDIPQEEADPPPWHPPCDPPALPPLCKPSSAE